MHACTCTVCGTGGELELGDSVRMVSIDQTREGLTDDNSVFEEVTGG